MKRLTGTRKGLEVLKKTVKVKVKVLKVKVKVLKVLTEVCKGVVRVLGVRVYSSDQCPYYPHQLLIVKGLKLQQFSML